jgi:hypothetical protein
MRPDPPRTPSVPRSFDVADTAPLSPAKRQFDALLGRHLAERWERRQAGHSTDGCIPTPRGESSGPR